MPTTLFWMVSVDGQSAPTKRYATLDDAKKEAARLACKEHNRAYVLQSMMAALPAENVTWQAALPSAPKESE